MRFHRTPNLAVIAVLCAVLGVGWLTWRFIGKDVDGTSSDWEEMRDSLAREWGMYPAMNRFFEDPDKQIPLQGSIDFGGQVSDLHWNIYACGTSAFEPVDPPVPLGSDGFSRWCADNGVEVCKSVVSDTQEHPVNEEWALGFELTGAVAGNEFWNARFRDDGVACIYYYNPRNGRFMCISGRCEATTAWKGTFAPAPVHPSCTDAHDTPQPAQTTRCENQQPLCTPGKAINRSMSPCKHPRCRFIFGAVAALWLTIPADSPAQPPDAAAPQPRPSKKLIEWGWDEPDPAFMRAHIGEMERLPFDGVVFHVNSSRGGNFVWEMWGGRRYERAEFDAAVADLRETPFQRLSERFLRVNVTPGNVDWFDDDAWSGVLHNARVAAQVARDGGCRGFMFDTEQYQHELFHFAKQPPGHTWQECRDTVRRRGAEWMRAVNAECPEITILLTFAYKMAQPAAGRPRSEARYGLLADFLDGVLEACSEQTAIVDAWEHSYSYRRAEQFDAARETMRTTALGWTAAPEKYQRHVKAGFGIWLDYNWPRHGWDTADLSKNYFSPPQFAESVRTALANSDGYVWIYTEQPRWWTSERLPTEYVEALRTARGEQ